MSNETLEIKKQDAIEAFKAGDANTKIVLQKLFPSVALSGKITDHVKTYEDACQILGIDSDLGLSCAKSGVWNDIENITAYAKLVVIIRALNEGWTPDWNNSNQSKYVPWFKHKSGFWLVYDGTSAWAASTCVGSRLCFKTSELAEYAAKQFGDLYNAYLTIKQ